MRYKILGRWRCGHDEDVGGDADGVHAELPAVVPGPLPVQLGIPTSFTPREMIGLAKSGLMDNS